MSMMIIETTKKLKKTANKLEDVMDMLSDAKKCLDDIMYEESFSERGGSVNMRGRYGDVDSRHDDDYPRYRRM